MKMRDVTGTAMRVSSGHKYPALCIKRTKLRRGVK
jgi:hypothetical protein